MVTPGRFRTNVGVYARTCVHMRVYGICTVCAELMRVVFRSGGAAYMRAHELMRVVFGRGDTSYTAACACERANARSIWLWRRPLIR